jgi:hypothetical protein
MYSHERENWRLDLKNEIVNLSTCTVMYATTDICSASENKALVAKITRRKKRRIQGNELRYILSPQYRHFMPFCA